VEQSKTRNEHGSGTQIATEVNSKETNLIPHLLIWLLPNVVLSGSPATRARLFKESATTACHSAVQLLAGNEKLQPALGYTPWPRVL
jgi:hypothetical protein